MIVGAELQRARRRAGRARARGGRAGAALARRAGDDRVARQRRRRSARGPRARSWACSSAKGSSTPPRPRDAVGALATAGVLESALVEAAVAEAEDALGDDR